MTYLIFIPPLPTPRAPTHIAAPAFAGAAVGIEITQTLNVNGVEYSMVRMKASEGSFMDGRTVGELQESEQMDIVLQGRQGEAEVQHDRLLGIVGRSRGVMRV